MTRRRNQPGGGAMRMLGRALTAAMADQRKADDAAPGPVHLVVPDAATADILVSIADNLAGVELSRLRWQRDREMGAPGADFQRRACHHSAAP